MKHFLTACAAAALIACSPANDERAAPSDNAAAQAPTPDVASLPAGTYRLDPAHASLIFQVNHIGISIYTASFSSIDAEMQLDPADPETAELTATVDILSLSLPTPPAGFHDTLMGPVWFDAGAHPKMTFTSTGVEKTGDGKARIKGILSLRGVEAPVVLDAEFIGGYSGLEVYDPQARVGFSGHGTIRRSDFGMTEGLPPPGTTIGVSDDVNITINAEFLGPPLATPSENE